MTIKARLEALERQHKPHDGPIDPLSKALLELEREHPDLRALAETLESDPIGGKY